MRVKYFLSICTAVAIIGCGTNSDYKAQDGGASSTDTGAKTDGTTNEGNSTDTVASYTQKGGLTGVVYTNETIGETSYSKICFDTNTNGVCDSSEASETIFTGGKFSFEKSVSDAHANQVLLSIVKTSESGNASYLTSYESDITPYSTLVVNETLYNPNANSNANTAKTLLSNKFGTSLSNEDSLKVFTTLQNAIRSGTNTYDSIASAVDSIYKQNTLSPNVTITSQTRASNLSGTTLTLNATDKSVTWEKTHEDETIMGANANANNAISYSRWHNSLRVVNLSDESLTSSGRFLDVSGARYATDSSTGASEQLLKKVAEDSSNNIFALVTKKGENTANSLGIYKSNVSNGVTNIKYSQVSAGANFYALDDGVDIAVSGTTLVVGGDSGLKTFQTSSLATPTHEVSGKKVKTLSISSSYIFAGNYARKANTLDIYNTSLNEVASLNTNDLTSSTATSLYPNKIASYQNRVYFTLNDDDLGKTIYCYEVDGTSLKAIKQLPISDSVLNLSVSDDGNYLVVTTWDKKLLVYDTSSFANTSATLSQVGYGGYIHENKISLAYKDSFGFYNLTKSSSTLTDADKQAWTSEHR